MTRAFPRGAGAVALALGLAATPAAADDGDDDAAPDVAGALEVVRGPWEPAPGAFDAAADVAAATALALPPDPAVPASAFGARVLRARARERAVDALHDFVDDALAARRAPPWLAQRAHDAVDRAAEVAAARALLDGGAVVRVVVPGNALRSAAPLAGVPWARGAR